MTTFALIPGAGGVSWYWHRLVPLLEDAHHEAIPVDLPGDDTQAGLSVYAQLVLEAIGTREAILVAQSLGGFTAPLVCARARVRTLVFVNAVIPAPGETSGAVVGQHRLAGSARRRRAPWWLQPELRSRHLLPPRPPTRDRETRRSTGAPQGRHRLRRVVQIRGVASGPDPRDRRTQRPLLPARVPASRRTGATASPPRRASRRPSPRACKPPRTRRPAPRLRSRRLTPARVAGGYLLVQSQQDDLRANRPRAGIDGPACTSCAGHPRSAERLVSGSGRIDCRKAARSNAPTSTRHPKPSSHRSVLSAYSSE